LDVLLLIHPTIASKHYLYEQYDQQVGANTIIKPGLQSSVVRVEGTNKAVASTIDGEARYVFNQPYELVDHIAHINNVLRQSLDVLEVS
jgi:phosphoribosylformylglycinamidine (FGAM) synthase-like enzyme